MKRKKKESDESDEVVKFKTPRRYRLSIDNENTLNRVFTFRMSSRRIMFLIACAVGVTILLGAVLLGFTPLKTLLPGYLRTADREEYLAADNRIDSLLNVVSNTNLYMDNLSKILSGDIEIDSLRMGSVPVTAAIENPDSLLAPTVAEIEFAREYERLSGVVAVDTLAFDAAEMHFMPPVHDAVVHRSGRPELPRIQLDPDHLTVYAIADATVMDCFRNNDGTYTMVLQHNDGYLSRYSGLSSLYYDRRQRVGAGSRIGVVAENDGARPRLGFELWRDGTALIPTSYIKF